MAEYNVFASLDALCEDSSEVDYLQLEDELLDLNLSQEIVISKEKQSKNTKRTNSIKSKTTTQQNSKNTASQNPEQDANEIITEPLQSTKKRTRGRKSTTGSASAIVQGASSSQPTNQGRRGRRSATGSGSIVSQSTTGSASAIVQGASSSQSTNQGKRGRRSATGSGSMVSQTRSLRSSGSRGRSRAQNVTRTANQILNLLETAAAAMSTSIVTRSRRNMIAEIAARAQVTDTIDLVSSPIVPVQGYYSLDSDDEAEPENAELLKNKEKALPKTQDNTKYDEANPELELKVMWHDKIDRFKLRKHQKFSHLIKKLSEVHDCDVNKIVCNLDDCIIQQDDTPSSIDLKLHHII